jgi:hypothetical protein
VSLVNSLWRAVAAYRLAAFGYAAVLMARAYSDYRHPFAGLVALAVMAVWTAIATFAYAAPARRTWLTVAADFAVAAGCLLASRHIIGTEQVALGSATVPMAWIAAPVIAAALFRGGLLGAAAAGRASPTDTWPRRRRPAGSG